MSDNQSSGGGEESGAETAGSIPSKTAVVLVVLSLLGLPAMGPIAAAWPSDDASLTVTAPSSVQLNETVQVTYNVTHTGVNDSSYFVDDVLPDGWSYVGIADQTVNGTVAYSSENDTLILLNRFEQGESGTVTLDVSAPANASGVSTFSPSAWDSIDTRVNATATVTVGADTLPTSEVTVSAPETAQPGDAVEISYTIENTAAVNQSYLITSGLPADWTVTDHTKNGSVIYTDQSDAFLWLEEFEPGVSKTFTATVAVPSDASETTISPRAMSGEGINSTTSATIEVSDEGSVVDEFDTNGQAGIQIGELNDGISAYFEDEISIQALDQLITAYFTS